MAKTQIIERVIRDALEDFFSVVAADGWRGREREVVSLFSFDALLPYVRAGTPLKSPSQICIEGAVPQVEQQGNHKKVVCKDLVIWPEPRSNHWTLNRDPIAVVEWKVRGPPSRGRTPLGLAVEGDVDWLVKFTRDRPTLGFAVGVDWQGEPRLVAHRVSKGTVQRGWLQLEARAADNKRLAPARPSAAPENPPRPSGSW